MKRLAMFLAFFLCLGLHLTMAQNVQITGTVIGSEDGQPLPGASIMVKGTNIGTTTDFQGKYTLSIPSDAKTLVVSFIGMTALEESVNGRTVINVSLKTSSQALDEVVVTALGIKRSQKALGYTATTVNSSEISASKDRSALNALQGKVAGINVSQSSGAPGASTRVFLRGYSSLGRSNQPLYVIDGIPLSNSSLGSTSINGGTDFGNGVNDINPDDIESLTILKGSGGTAIYGSRAANGVIVITTKKGTNRQGKGAVIEVSSSYTMSTPLRTPHFQNEFGQGWYDGSMAANLEENGSWGPKFDGKMHLWGHIVDNQQQMKPYVALESNYRDFFETGKTFNNSISVSNGNENSSYYLSYNNVDDNGIMPTNADSYKRNEFSLKGSTKISKKITSSASISYLNKKGKFVPTGQDQSALDGLFQLPRDISIVDQKDYKGKFYNQDNYFTVFAQNPYFILNEHGNDLAQNRVWGNFQTDYQMLPWLNATFRAGTDVSNIQLKEWRAIFNSSRGDYNDEVGRVTESTFFSQTLNTDFFITINKEFAKNFRINAILGHNFYQSETRDESAQVIGLDIPNYYQLSNSSATPTAFATTSKRRLIGAYSAIELSYKDYLFLNLTGRNDWSSTLPENSRSFFYPSVNTSFVFSELLQSIKNILSYGKLRLGISKTGNDAPAYQLNTVFVQPEFTDGYRSVTLPLPNGVNGFSISNRIGNNDLKPEIKTEKEIGLDVRFLDNRIGIDLTYYDNYSTNQIIAATIARSSGYSSQTKNIGKITNSGIELLLTVVPIKTKDFSWKFTWNYSNNKNRLASLTPGLDQFPIGGTSSLAFVGRPGQPLGLYVGTVVQKDPQGRIVVDSNNGLPIANPTAQVYGNSQYNYIAGLGSLFTYKGLSLNITFDIRQGGMMYSRTQELAYFTGNAPQTTFNDREPFIIPNSVIKQANGTYIENTVPIVGSNNNMNLYYNQSNGATLYQRAYTIPKSFVKLREVVLTYNLPRSILSKSLVKDVQISIIGRNLLLWTPKDNVMIDPESTTFGNDIEADFGEYGATPSVRSFGANLKLTF